MQKPDSPQNVEKLLAQLKSSKMLEGVEEEKLKEILPQLQEIYLNDGEKLFDEEKGKEYFYALIEGELQTSANAEKIEVGDIVRKSPAKFSKESPAKIESVGKTKVIKMPKNAFQHIMSPNLPAQGLNIATPILTSTSIQETLKHKYILSALKNLFDDCNDEILSEIEQHLEWIQLQAGDFLFRQGETGQEMYILVGGLLQVSIHHETNKEEQIVGQIKKGECTGEMALFTGEPRSANVYAVRDSTVVKLTKKEFEKISQQYPQMLMGITKNIIQRLQKSNIAATTTPDKINITVIPISPDLPISDFCERLKKSLLNWGLVEHINSEMVNKQFGKEIAQTQAYNVTSNLMLSNWLQDREIIYDFILYQADSTTSPWTKRALSHADHILLVGKAGARPDLCEIETQLLKENNLQKTTKDLVLLHPNGEQQPTGTIKWLEPREVELHHHLRLDRETDFERLARFLTGNAIGLALGGGGTRAGTHLGVIQALLEKNIPIDMAGGTSMGSAAAGIYCSGIGIEEAKEGLKENVFKDYTVPKISLFKGELVEASFQKTYKERNVEDLWIPFFSLATDLSVGKRKLFREGLLWKAIRASISIPGILPPFIDEGHLLVDGAVVDNIPSGVMKQLCRGFVITVDISGDEDFTCPSFSKAPNFSKILGSKLSPFKETIQFPSITDIIMRSVLISNVAYKQETLDNSDLYLQPPLGDIGVLDFESVDEVFNIGYQYSKEKLEKNASLFTKYLKQT